jgi:hypothetical protein
MLPRMVSVLTLSPEETPLCLPDTTPILVATSAPSPIAVRICADIHRLNPTDPVVIVTSGAIAQLLPSIAFAQRTAHRNVAGYVLVDPIFPNQAPDWPDAPVLVLGHSPINERDARLRGWTFRTATTNEEIAQSVRAFVEDVTLTSPTDGE